VDRQVASGLTSPTALAVAPDGRVFITQPHTKWAVIESGRIVSFQTSFSGELYAVLREHSMLTRAAAGTPASADANDEAHAFQLGLTRNRELPNAPLTHLLFEVRSRQLTGNLTAAQALAFLSGLIIGQDIAGAMSLITRAGAQSRSLPLIGAPQLLERYHTALAAYGIDAQRIDATESTILGLKTLAQTDSPVSQ
jgi:2-dehydro-3-deoxygalactonokinase